MPGSIELSEFFVEGKNPDLSHVLLHITEPSTPKERQKGYFFALVEIEEGTREHIEELQQIINEIETGFYQMDDTADKSAFELALEYANRKGAHLNDPSHHARIHCVIGNVLENKLTFSYRGDVHALIFYQGQEGVERLNILDQHNPEDERQLFSSTLEGNLGDHDVVFIGTPCVTDHFAYDRLQKILSSRSPRDSAEHIGRVLHDIGDEKSFGGIVFHVSTHAVSPRTGKPIPKHTQGSVTSLNNLISAQQHTEETLSPPLLKGMRSRIKDRWQQEEALPPEKIPRKQLLKSTHPTPHRTTANSETNYRKGASTPAETLFNRILVIIGRGLVNLAIGIGTALKYLAMMIGRGAIMLVILITNKNNSRKEIVGRFKERLEYRKRAVRKMSLVSKILLVAIGTFAVLFVGSIAYLKVKEQREAKERAYLVLVDEIRQLKEEADTKLVYNDNVKALSLLQTAEGKITELPSQTEEQKNQITSLTAEIESLLQRLRKQEIVTPTPVLTLSEQYPEAKATSIARIGSDIVLFGVHDPVLYMYQPSIERVDTVSHDIIPTLTDSVYAKETEQLIFLSGPMTIAGYSKANNTVAPRDIAFPNTDTSIVTFDIYNDKLYTVDPTNNQIYKHNRTQIGYDKGTAWVQDTTADLTDAVSLTIDGDVYVLRSRGDVLKLHRGTIQPFSLASVDPALTNPTVIWTNTENNTLYILEPTNKRILLFTKDGKFIKQLTATEWQQPSDMVIDVERQTLYVTDNNIVYSLPLQ